LGGAEIGTSRASGATGLQQQQQHQSHQQQGIMTTSQQNVGGGNPLTVHHPRNEDDTWRRRRNGNEHDGNNAKVIHGWPPVKDIPLNCANGPIPPFFTLPLSKADISRFSFQFFPIIELLLPSFMNSGKSTVGAPNFAGLG
jgi:hypothetical protein